MTGAFSSETVEMLSASDLAADIATDLKRELDLLIQRWEDLSSTWDGTAAKAYRPSWDEWHEGATKVIDALDGTSKLLAQAAYTFLDADTGSAGNITAAGPH